MKKLLTVAAILTFGLIACNSEGVFSPKNSGVDVNEVVGTWVSVDSALFRNPSGFYVYRHDTLVFSTDTLNVGRSISPYMIMSGNIYAYYEFTYEEEGELGLDYKGPELSALQDTIYQNTFDLSPDGNTMTISGLSATYPISYFDKYVRID